MTTEINFQGMYQQAEQNIQQDQYAFAPDQMNPMKIRLINPTVIHPRQLSPIEARMLQKVQQIDDYSWNRDARGGLATGFPLFEEAIEGGVQSALYLIAAAPNVGKSAWLAQLLKQISRLNDNVHVAYHSLDDSENELTPRIIACEQQITIAQAKNPARFMDKPDIIAKRNEGIKDLYRNAHKFSIWDSNDGTSVESVEQRIKELKMTLPEGTKIVLGIDSIYDLTVESKQLQDKALYEYVAKTVKGWVTAYDVAIFATAHLKKNGGRRPVNEDLKENNRLEYEANFIALLYNEVGVKEEGAQVYWLDEDGESKMPVIEFRVGKNKLGSFKGTRFYEFMPNYSYCIEAPIESCRRYASLVYQS